MGSKSPGVQETPQQAALVEKARAQLDDYKARWLPLQKRMAQQIMDMGESDSGDRLRAKGRASTETAARFDQARSAVEKSMTNAGRGPGSSAFALAQTGLDSDAATSKASGMASSNAAIDNAYVQGLGALTAIGRGEKAQAIQGDTQLAAMSGRQAAQDAEMAAADRAGNMKLLGTIAGAGLNASMNRTSNVPQSAINTANMSPDPIGSLNSQMGWTP